ncbi:hypothetical protein P691DRAFT_286154 [Macrolepiota fuliginosa MF-IS2]|uniref:Uncharacterized protein n=1 Tax=Macrolepiota fuliginosa MF-IS2 TaxID=1400762 RepID=A0A9P6C523_9AGAR|nr:hypothetical protein P691DRAFT_286154 [Macrolepiota fuliginosa MF-IS2]
MGYWFTENTDKTMKALLRTLGERAPDGDPDGTAEVLEAEPITLAELVGADAATLVVGELGALLVGAEVAGVCAEVVIEVAAEAGMEVETEAGVDAEMEVEVEMGTETGLDEPSAEDEAAVVESSLTVHVWTS